MGVRIKSILILTCLMLLVSCGARRTSLPSYLEKPWTHPKYPPSSYITAVGASEKSFAEAERIAKANVSAQVRSEIVAVIEDELGKTSIDGKTVEYEKVLYKVKQTSKFSHAEMIRFDYSSSIKADKYYYAFAYLSRGDIFHVLASEYEMAAVKFRQSAASVSSFKNDVSAFTAALRQAEDSFTTLAAKVFELRAITRREYGEYPEDLARYLKVESDKIALLRSIRMTVNVSGNCSASERSKIASAITGALSKLGLGTTIGDCSPQLYTLHVNARTNCERGNLGPACALTMSGVLEQCTPKRTLAEFNLTDQTFKAMHPREEDIALEILYRKITPETLLPFLQKGLSSVMPIEMGAQ